MSERNNMDRLGSHEQEPVQSALKVSGNHLTEIIDLPSEGEYYDHPSLSSGKIEIYLMVARHDDILSNQSYFVNGVIEDKLLNSLVVDTTIDLGTLLPIDATAILMAARASAYGETFKAKVKCKGENCKIENEVVVSLVDDAKIIGGPSKKYGTSITGGKIQVPLPKSGKVINCKMNQKSFENEVLAILVKKHGVKKKDLLAKAIDGSLDMLVPNADYLPIIVDSIEGVEETKTKSELLNLPLFDTRYLKGAYHDTVLRYQMKKEVTCACGKTDTVEVGIMTPDFFWPEL